MIAKTASYRRQLAQLGFKRKFLVPGSQQGEFGANAGAGNTQTAGRMTTAHAIGRGRAVGVMCSIFGLL